MVEVLTPCTKHQNKLRLLSRLAELWQPSLVCRTSPGKPQCQPNSSLQLQSLAPLSVAVGADHPEDIAVERLFFVGQALRISQ